MASYRIWFSCNEMTYFPFLSFCLLFHINQILPIRRYTSVHSYRQMLGNIIFKLELVFSLQVCRFPVDPDIFNPVLSCYNFCFCCSHYLCKCHKVVSNLLLPLNVALGSSASKTLSWHLASETKSTLKGNLHSPTKWVKILIRKFLKLSIVVFKIYLFLFFFIFFYLFIWCSQFSIIIGYFWMCSTEDTKNSGRTPEIFRLLGM